MRTKAKRDAGEKAIVDALRAAGIGVYRLNDPGAPDLIAWKGDTRQGWMVLLEVKAKTGRLTKAQQTYTGPRIVVRSPKEALAVFGIKRA